MYIIEGNIGVGKSTFLTQFKKYDFTIHTTLEPINNWANEQYGQSLLTNFYKDPKRWAYTLETLAMICRVRDHLHEQKQTNPRRIIERSIYSGHYCFAQNGYKNGYFTEIEWKIYQKWVTFLIEQKCKPPHGFIYLKATPEVCFKRMLARNRTSEKQVSIEYLQQIEAQHEKLLITKQEIFKSLEPIPVLVLDCNTEFENNHATMQTHTKKVNDFISRTEAKLSKP